MNIIDHGFNRIEIFQIRDIANCDYAFRDYEEAEKDDLRRQHRNESVRCIKVTETELPVLFHLKEIEQHTADDKHQKRQNEARGS
jgi:hypothetical protein